MHKAWPRALGSVFLGVLTAAPTCERVPPPVEVGRYWAVLSAYGKPSKPVSFYFEYKPHSLDSWSFVPKTPARSVAAGTDLSTIKTWLYGLQPAIQYDYRLCLKDDTGAVVCDTPNPPFSFTTQPASTLKRVKIDPANPERLVLEDGQRFVPWGNNYVGVTGGAVNQQMVEDQMYDEQGRARIAADLARLSRIAPNANMNTIRMHLQLHEFLLDAVTPNAEALARFCRVLESVEDQGLYVMLTGLNYFYPKDNPVWIAEQTEAQHWNTQALWWNAMAAALRHSPGIFAYDLMNEPYVGSAALVVDGKARWTTVPYNQYCSYGENLATGEHGTCFGQYISLDPNGRSAAEIATSWTARMIHAIRYSGFFQNDSQRLITIGVGAFGMNNVFHNTPGVRDQLSLLSPHLYGQAADLGQSEIDLAQSLSTLSTKPVVAGETFPLGGTEAQERLLSQTCNDQTAQGWIGQYDGRELGDPCPPDRNIFGCALFDAWYALQGKWGPAISSGSCLARIP